MLWYDLLPLKNASWTTTKTDELHTEALKMNGLRQTMLVPRTTRKTDKLVLEKAGSIKNLLASVTVYWLCYDAQLLEKDKI